MLLIVIVVINGISMRSMDQTFFFKLSIPTFQCSNNIREMIGKLKLSQIYLGTLCESLHGDYCEKFNIKACGKEA